MHTIRINKIDFEAAMAKAGEEYTLAGPVSEKGQHVFRCLEKGEFPDMEYTQTRLSPKSLLFPQAEVMLRFTAGDSGTAVTEATSALDSPLAIVGIRPYDAKALELLRLNFDAKQYKDPFFVKRYAQMVRVGLADIMPSATNFSLACGSGPFDETCLDILIADAGEEFIGKVLTEKGKAFAAAAGFADAGPKVEEQLASMQAKAEALVDTTPVFEHILEADTLELYESDVWEQLSFSCIKCGACTFACPTCWCFDIQDEMKDGEGVRLRLWDTCMADQYSAHASGHNPREQGLQRFRNRFMHKLKYFADKYGEGIMCVGCGRCISACPAGIDIRNVMNVTNEVAGKKEMAAC